MSSDIPPEPPIDQLLGSSLLQKADGTKVDTKKALKDKKLVGLYFSASWCPPCKAFSPLLIDFYNKVSKEVEIVYVSSDQSTEEFENYYKKMPWLAIPTDKESTQLKHGLAKVFGIQGIPTLIILDAQTGRFVTADARSDVQSNKGDPKEVVNKWTQIESIPVSEARQAASQGFIKTLLYVCFLVES